MRFSGKSPIRWAFRVIIRYGRALERQFQTFQARYFPPLDHTLFDVALSVDGVKFLMIALLSPLIYGAVVGFTLLLPEKSGRIHHILAEVVKVGLICYGSLVEWFFIVAPYLRYLGLAHRREVRIGTATYEVPIALALRSAFLVPAILEYLQQRVQQWNFTPTLLRQKPHKLSASYLIHTAHVPDPSKEKLFPLPSHPSKRKIAEKVSHFFFGRGRRLLSFSHTSWTQAMLTLKLLSYLSRATLSEILKDTPSFLFSIILGLWIAKTGHWEILLFIFAALILIAILEALELEKLHLFSGKNRAIRTLMPLTTWIKKQLQKFRDWVHAEIKQATLEEDAWIGSTEKSPNAIQNTHSIAKHEEGITYIPPSCMEDLLDRIKKEDSLIQRLEEIAKSVPSQRLYRCIVEVPSLRFEIDQLRYGEEELGYGWSPTEAMQVCFFWDYPPDEMCRRRWRALNPETQGALQKVLEQSLFLLNAPWASYVHKVYPELIPERIVVRIEGEIKEIQVKEVFDSQKLRKEPLISLL